MAVVLAVGCFHHHRCHRRQYYDYHDDNTHTVEDWMVAKILAVPPKFVPIPAKYLVNSKKRVENKIPSLFFWVTKNIYEMDLVNALKK